MDVDFDMDEYSDISTGCEKPEINHHLLDQTTKHITELYEKYSHDLYMTSKIYHYISQQLPSLLVNVYETRQKNAQRMETHIAEQEKFITDYMMVHIIKNVKKMMYYMILYPVLQKHIIIQFKIGNIKQKSLYYGKSRTMY
jgi:hypothetical protein